MDFELLHSMKLTLLYSPVQNFNIFGDLCLGYPLKLQSVLTKKITMANRFSSNQYWVLISTFILHFKTPEVVSSNLPCCI